MSKNKENKKKIIKKIKNIALESNSAAIATYNGVKSNEINQLRKEARKFNIHLKVIKNNIARIATKDTIFECMKNELKGQILIAFNDSDPTLIAKLFNKFVERNKSLEIKIISFGNEIFGKDKIIELAKLPDRKTSIMMLCKMLRFPIKKFIESTKEIPNSLIKTLNVICKKTK